MKILLGHCFYRSSAPSGEDAVYRNEKQLLIDNGHTVIPLELQNDDIKADGLIGKLRVGFETGWSKRSYEIVMQQLSHHKPDIAHFHNIFPQLSPSVYQACRDAGIPAVQTLHNYRYLCPNALLMREGKPCELCIDHGIYNAVRYRCYRDSLLATLPLARMIIKNRRNGVFATVNRYIALTEFARSRFITAGFNPDNVVVKPNFLALPESFQPADHLDDYFVFAGRLTEEKGVRTLIKAWCTEGMPELRIMGSGALFDELQKSVQQYQANVKFLGLVDKPTLLEQVRSARAVIIPSICYEGFPMAVLEAFSLGVPVIASDLGSLKSLINDGETGIRFSAGDSGSLRHAVHRLLSLDSDKTIRQKCLNTFQQRYTPEQNIRQLEEIYTKTIENHT